MKPRTSANIILVLVGTGLAILFVFGLVGLYRSWAHAHSLTLSVTHKIGITALAIGVAVLLVERLSNLVFLRGRRRLTTEQLDAITAHVSIFQPVKDLLATPATPDYGKFESRLSEFCKLVDGTKKSDEWKRRKIKGLEVMVKTGDSQYDAHLALGLATMSDLYRWVPQPEDDLLVTIATTGDLGAIGQILWDLVKRGDARAALVELKYDHQCKKHGLVPLPLPVRKRILTMSPPNNADNEPDPNKSLKAFRQQLIMTGT